MEHAKEQFDKAKPGEPVVLACVVLQLRDAVNLVDLLRSASADLQNCAAEGPVLLETVPHQPQPEDSWLDHSAAAEYLGVSKSTLYKYACQQKIECRKLCGRLEYCRSELDRFKQEQVRPARRLERRSIITSAHSSGK
jgi:hypothetical protein